MDLFVNPRYPKWIKKLAIFMIAFWLLFGTAVVALAFYMVYLNLSNI